jgi:putative aldouronate transport system substrate-binding protein
LRISRVMITGRIAGWDVDDSGKVTLNPMYSLESPSFSSEGSELQKIITDATYKFILEKIDLGGFKQEVKK